MDQKSTSINSLQVSYTHKSAADKKATVVFIHGFPFNKSIWDQQMTALPPEIVGIAYDIRGFGSSSADHHFFSIDLFVKDLKNLIDSLTSMPVILCGISMGGYIALRFAELHSAKLAGLILCDTNCIADSNDAKIKRFASVDLIMSGARDEFTEGFVKNVFSDSTLQSMPEVVSFLKSVIDSTSQETISATQLALAARTDTSKVLPLIKAPTLVIRGAGDKLMSVEQTEQLTQGIQGAGYLSIEESGHLPNLENPEDFNKAMLTFLAKHF